MGLRADINEVVEIWQTSPWRVKLFLALSLFLASSSLASLSEAVVKWKGFILAGIALYRDYINAPVVDFISTQFSINFTRMAVDVAALCALSFGALIRGFFVDLRIDRSRLNRIVTYVLTGAMIAGAVIIVGNVAAAGSKVTFNVPWLVSGYTLTILYLAIGPPRSAWKLVSLIYLVVPPLLVCIVAAINLGLS